jgi:hypothetical protein
MLLSGSELFKKRNTSEELVYTRVCTWMGHACTHGCARGRDMLLNSDWSFFFFFPIQVKLKEGMHAAAMSESMVLIIKPCDHYLRILFLKYLLQRQYDYI